jgi:hypothetical protein
MDGGSEAAREEERRMDAPRRASPTHHVTHVTGLLNELLR